MNKKDKQILAKMRPKFKSFDTARDLCEKSEELDRPHDLSHRKSRRRRVPRTRQPQHLQARMPSDITHTDAPKNASRANLSLFFIDTSQKIVKIVNLPDDPRHPAGSMPATAALKLTPLQEKGSIP